MGLQPAHLRRRQPGHIAEEDAIVVRQAAQTGVGELGLVDHLDAKGRVHRPRSAVIRIEGLVQPLGAAIQDLPLARFAVDQHHWHVLLDGEHGRARVVEFQGVSLQANLQDIRARRAELVGKAEGVGTTIDAFPELIDQTHFQRRIGRRHPSFPDPQFHPHAVTGFAAVIEDGGGDGQDGTGRGQRRRPSVRLVTARLLMPSSPTSMKIVRALA